jgi:hypothetical protein
MMTKDEKRARLYLLFHALQFCSQQKAVLNPIERILVNQERASLLYALDFPKSKIKAVPAHVEIKLKEITRLTGVYNWKPLNKKDPFQC